MGSLGPLRKPHDLSFITQRGGQANEPKDENIVKDVKPATPDKDVKVLKEPKKNKNDIDVDELIPFGLRLKPKVVDRLYAEKFFDIGQRPIQEVVGEIIEEALARRKDPGPAPAAFVAAMKSRGRPKKP